MRGIYIKEEVRSRKIPAQYPTKISVVRFASRYITWGTRSRKNLLKVHLERLKAKNVPWAVKKTSSLVEVGCRGHRATTMTLKSSFLPDELERRISRGFCRGVGPRNPLFMWVLGLRPKPRTRDRSRRDKHYQGSSC